LNCNEYPDTGSDIIENAWLQLTMDISRLSQSQTRSSLIVHMLSLHS